MSAITSTRIQRVINATASWNDNQNHEAPPNTTAHIENDSNADTCCLGKNFIVLEHTRRTADVYAYDKSITPIHNVPIVSGATAYDCPTTNTTYILVFHESLFYGDRLDHSLMNPNQLRSFGIPLWDNPYDPHHDLAIDADSHLTIPLQMKGTKIYFTTRVPTATELRDCPMVSLTSKQTWEPTAIRLGISSVATSAVTSTRLYTDGDALSMQPSLPFSDCGGDRSISSVHIRTRCHNDSEHYFPQLASVTHDTLDIPVRRTFVSTERHARITAENLSERFGIGIARARETLRATLQKGVRSAILPLGRRYRADRMFGRRRLEGRFSSDTAWFKVKSLRGNVASQIYYHKCGFSAGYNIPQANDAHVGNSLADFMSDFGVPAHLTVDGASVQTGRHTKFMKHVKDNDIGFHVSHPRRPDENPSEGGIREIKRRFYRLMQKHDIPMRLWDFVLDYTLETMNVTVNTSKYSNGRVPLEIITGITPDISELLDFHIYQWVYFKSNAGFAKREIGRWLGPSHKVGRAMTYWILPESGIPISCDTVQQVTEAEKQTDETREQMRIWTEKTRPILEAQSSDVQGTLRDVHPDKIFDLSTEEDEFAAEFQRVLNDPDVAEQDEIIKMVEVEPDPYVNMTIGLKRGKDGEEIEARVVKRARDADGNLLGTAHHNAMVDTRLYEVEYVDGNVETLAANVLAENILSQVDEEGHRQKIIDEIVDHRVLDDAIPKSKGTYLTSTGRERKVQTTRGWQLYVQFKDGSGAWMALKDVKDSFPIELAEYGKSRGLLEEPALAWWAPHTLKKSARVLGKLKSKYWDRTHKYGIRVPKSVKQAKEIDAENGDTLWMDAIRMEMKNAMIAFEEYDGDVRDLVGYQEITGHLVFDVKLGENFRRKARFCADGHKTEAPSSITYSSVVSRDSVRIMLMIAALNDLDLRSADVQNAFLTAPNLEKCYMRAGPEFGENEGKVYIVRRALYGLRSASAAFRAFMAERLDQMGFTSSVADPDVWYRAAVKSDGECYYEYVLAYVDDLLAISVDPVGVMKQIEKRFKFKGDKIEVPSSYLGAKLSLRDSYGKKVWAITSEEYIKASLKTVEAAIQGTSWKLPGKVDGPMTSSYVPELDGTPELDDKDASMFREFIGILRWSTEIGRVDIVHEISLLSSYQAVPRQGHMEQVLHIFAYLKKKGKLSLYMDPRLPNIDYTDSTSNKDAFKMHYRDAKEEKPARAPTPRGKPVNMLAFVDASHGGNKKTRRSYTGYIIFIQNAPILWYSKAQNTVETSAFSAEFVSMKTVIEAITHLRYKLRMFGIPIQDDGPARIFCDNESVVKNSSNIESTLNKKHVSIAYHFTRWNVAAGVVDVSWIDTHSNLSDPYTKRLSETKRDHHFGNWTY